MNKVSFLRFPDLDYAVNEALNTLCTNLTFAGVDIRKIMITSCRQSEGKTFVSLNIMRKMAELGKRVVLVDADLRRSKIESHYRVKVEKGGSMGLSQYLAGMCDVQDILCRTNIPNADLVLAGRIVLDSLSLLSTPRFPALMEQLGEQYDMVIVDVPPSGIIIDASEIAKSCDGALIVVAYNQIRRRELMETKRQIEMTGCQILGAVLNNVKFDSFISRRYYYRSYYSNYSYRSYYAPLEYRPDEPKKKRKSADKGK